MRTKRAGTRDPIGSRRVTNKVGGEWVACAGARLLTCADKAGQIDAEKRGAWGVAGDTGERIKNGLRHWHKRKICVGDSPPLCSLLEGVGRYLMDITHKVFRRRLPLPALPRKDKGVWSISKNC